MTADAAHAAAARLTEASTPAEVLAVLGQFRRLWWPEGATAPGTVAWLMADLLPRWVAAAATAEPAAIVKARGGVALEGDSGSCSSSDDEPAQSSPLASVPAVPVGEASAACSWPNCNCPVDKAVCGEASAEPAANEKSGKHESRRARGDFGSAVRFAGEEQIAAAGVRAEDETPAALHDDVETIRDALNDLRYVRAYGALVALDRLVASVGLRQPQDSEDA